MNRLKNKQALITGSSKGIGWGLAKIFVQEGADVFLCARNETALKTAAEELAALAGNEDRVAFHAADVADAKEAETLAQVVSERFPKLNVLINNASILGKRAPITEVDVATWDEVLRVNTSSLLYVTKPLIGLLVRNSGSVINVSSSVGKKGKPNWGPYAVSKFGLEGFTQVLAAELEPKGVRVNSVNPGATRTDMRAAAYPDEDPLSLPTGEDISEIFVHLASDESKDITGQAFEARDYLPNPK